MASSSGEGSGQLVEVFVQGVLDGGKLEALRDRLDALCDGAPDAATPFDYIERIYNSERAAQNRRPAVVRVQQHSSGLWNLVYQGMLKTSDEDKTAQRPLSTMECSANAPDFVQKMGFNFDFALRKRGWCYNRGYIVITITQLMTLKSVDRPEDAMQVNDSYLVEVSLLAPSLRVKELRKDVLMMSKQLAPIVKLEPLNEEKLSMIIAPKPK